MRPLETDLSHSGVEAASDGHSGAQRRNDNPPVFEHLGVEMFRVRKAGLHSTVQDLGRYQTRRFGLATSGAADKFALQVGNALLGNPPSAAGIEVTLMGLQLEVVGSCRIAVTGADLGFAINGRAVRSWVVCNVFAGDILDFYGGEHGCRSYLCVNGGLDVPQVFQSGSTDIVVGIGGVDGRPLQPGDVLSAMTTARNRNGTAGADARAGRSGDVAMGGTASDNGDRSDHSDRSDHLESLQRNSAGRQSRWLSRADRDYITSTALVRVLPGPQVHHFTREAWETFLSSEYTVDPDSNRVGLRLIGDKLEHVAEASVADFGADILSEPVPEGAIQVPANGQPIVLMADRRTIGGYAKIATAITVDIRKLAQLRPGGKVRFECVTLSEAQRLLRRQSQFWRMARLCW